MSRRLLLIVWIGFLVLTSFVSFHHEQWRDEADSWLIARDQSPITVLPIMPNAGHPVLHYLVQMPLAKFGLPYWTSKVLNLAWMAIAVLLLLQFSRIPQLLKILLCFGYLLSYEYAVIVRGYSLATALLFALAAVDGNRWKRPVLYGILLGLLAHTEAYFTLFAGALWIINATGFPKRPNRSQVVGVTVSLLMIVVSVLILWPSGKGAESSLFFARFDLAAVPTLIGSAFFPILHVEAAAYLAALIVILGLMVVASDRRVLAILLAATAICVYVAVFKFPGWVRHHGLYGMFWVFGLWLFYGTFQRNPLPVTFRTWQENLRNAWLSLYGFAAAVSVVAAAHAWYADVNGTFSQSRQMADFLTRNNIDRYPIAAYRPVFGSSVLPMLESTRSLYYPSQERWGSHMFWDVAYANDKKIRFAQVMRRMKEEFPQWDSPSSDPVFLITNQEGVHPDLQFLFGARAGNYFKTAYFRPWRPGEEMFLYQLKKSRYAR